MKKFKFSVYLFMICCIISSCGSGSDKKSTGEISEDSKNIAVCIWDKVPLRNAPGDKAKWLTSISLGEKIQYLKESAIDSTSGKEVIYYNVALQDGTEGWVRSDFIVLDGKPVVFVNSTNYYNRPDLLTKNDKSFSMMDIAGVKSTQGDWVEVVGKRSGGSWIETGWVKSSNVSYKETDIAVAKFANAAFAQKDEEKKLAGLKEIMDNTDLQSSVFIATLSEIVQDMTMAGQEIEFAIDTLDVADQY
jgi:hypothetical protein